MPIYLPETTDFHDPVADAAADRRRARQVRRRPAPGQARGRDRAAQPDAAAEAPRRDGRGGGAEEHPDDRSDRRGKDGDRAAPRQARAVAVPEDRGVEVHRGRLRGPRRGVDDPRPHRDRRGARARGADRRSAREGEDGGGGARPRPAAAAATARRPSTTRGPRRSASRRSARARSCASSSARAGSTTSSSKSTSARSRSRPSRSSPGRRSRKSTST